MVTSYYPSSLAEALQLKKRYPLTAYAGGTDLMLQDQTHQGLLFLRQLPELCQIKEEGGYVRIGAACTFTELLASPLVPELLQAALRQLAAPAIRNQGTSGGNLCNGSPKADSAVVYVVLDAVLRLCSAEGERLVPIREFYLGRNQTCLRPEELLVEILVPKQTGRHFYYQKVGGRKALAIARVSIAGVFGLEQEKIVSFAVAFGAVADTVQRYYDLEAQLLGKSLAEARSLRAEMLAGYTERLQPISGRVSARWRKQVCLNLLQDFWTECGL